MSKVLPEAKRLAGVRVAGRTLFYKVRPLIQRFTGDVELDYKYFSERLLPEYQRRDGLARHGAAAKLVPPDDVLNSYAQQAGEDALTYLVPTRSSVGSTCPPSWPNSSRSTPSWAKSPR